MSFIILQVVKEILHQLGQVWRILKTANFISPMIFSTLCYLVF